MGRLVRTKLFAVYVRPKHWRLGWHRRYTRPVLPTLDQISDLESILGVGTPVPEARPAKLVHVEVHLGPVEVRILRR